MSTVWLGVLIAALVLFGGTVLICSVRGFGDILSLFRTLQEDDEPTDPG